MKNRLFFYSSQKLRFLLSRAASRLKIMFIITTFTLLRLKIETPVCDIGFQSKLT